MQQPLDLAQIPLRGLHLIEASAGTGKTFAITNLVLRMLLEAGLGIDQVLVLTFTNAATEELRERVAHRLRAAAAGLEATPASALAATDPVLAALLGQVAPALARVRLAAAIAALDQAAIYTIHGFCQRLLRDHAFESGVRFEPELIQDETELRRTVVEDLWRREMADADREQAAWLLANWSDGPSGLLATLAGHLGGEAPRLVPDPTTIAGAADPLPALRDWRERLRARWAQDAEEVMALLHASPALKRNIYRPASIAAVPAAVQTVLEAETLPANLPKPFTLLTPPRLAAATKKGHAPPQHPLFNLCGEIDAEALVAAAAQRRAAFLGGALQALRQGLTAAKAARGLLYFDDLLRLTAAALAGPLGGRLAERIRAAHPCVLIDEFQDTDPLQYRIFQQVYADHAACGLFLIGDPKQAIYAFRGADIFTYMAARQAALAAGRLWTLDTNWRSASALVAAVNALFERAHRPFVYHEQIPFLPVRPGPRADAEPLCIDGDTPAPLQLRWLPLVPAHCTQDGRRLKTDDALKLAAEDTAEQIAALIAAGAAGRARIGAQPLLPRDIAVLVRRHRDGLAVRAALTARGVASVSLDQASVFASEEAAELALLLTALDAGASSGEIRAALATRLLGCDAARIAALDQDEAAWDALLGRLQGYRACWQARGFLPAFWQVLHGEDCIASLRRGPDGERRLTNLLHLAELAQLAAREHPGIDNLLAWLAQVRAAASRASEETQLRLESDAELVRILTLHKSKGLEFPVVFLPAPWAGSPAPGPADPLAYHAEDGSAWLDLGSPGRDAALARQRCEDLAEGLRLCYVGLTRARHLCVLHWGAVNQAGTSAAAYLLHPDPDLDGVQDRMCDAEDAALRAGLADLLAAAPGAIAISTALEQLLVPSPVPSPVLPAAAGKTPAPRARPFRGQIPRDWRLLSFSGLVAGAGGGEAALGWAASGPDQPDYDAQLAPAAEAALLSTTPAPVPRSDAEPSVDCDPVFRFPRGIRAGHCLHALFEQLDFPRAQGAVLDEVVQRTLARHGIAPGWGTAAATLVTRTLDTALNAQGLCLRQVEPADSVVELEFHFALAGTRPGQLAALLAAHGYADAAHGLALAGEAADSIPPVGSQPALRQPSGTAASPLNGLMKGYIDLVFRHQGRFYLVDYKSNHLGDHADAYAPAELDAAMTAHRYRLQYLIYLVALQRWLRRRLPDYDPARHLGGVFYLFLRGLHPATGPARGVVHDCPAPALINALDGAFGGMPS
ncbi:MAG: exodeoxyribonuclease V subunit beta [Chromatiaceae bacterium]|nr:MAG: exodeoxyribonuclease V subunit beta [Chromatiaceae bacterium]